MASIFSDPFPSGNRFFAAFACLAVFGIASAAENAAPELRPGVLEPRMKVELSSEFALPVLRVFPRVGDSFRKGDVLIEFGATQAEAVLAAAEAAEKAAFANLLGNQTLAETRQVTEVEVAMAGQRHAEAVARRVAAEREVAATRLIAPFSGKVAERRINDHEWAAQGARLLTLVDDTVLEVRFILPESAFRSVGAGLPVRVRVPAAGGVAEATVSRVSAVFDAASRTFDIWAVLDNSRNIYRVGMVAEVDVPLNAPGAP